MKHSILCTLLAALSWGAVSGAAHAENTQARPRLSVTAARAAPGMSARPDDPAWAGAAEVSGMPLSLGEQGEGETPPPTRVKVLWDKDYLYVRFVCAATELYSPYKKHDEPIYNGDCVEVFLDVKGDAKQWMELEVSPRNITFDQITTLTAEPLSDSDLVLDPALRATDRWPNPGWNLDGLRTAVSAQRVGRRITGWTVDIALPAKPMLRRLGLDHFAPMTLRANFLRYEYPRGNRGAKRSLIAMNWAPVRWGCPHLSPRAMGFLDLIPSP